MVLYLCGAAMLELNLLSFTGHQSIAFGWVSTGLLLYSALLSFFVVEYLFFEEVHLYTYDFVAERVGFKLGWGCLAFYPYFYCIGAWSVAGRPPRDAPVWLYLLAAAVFFAGWVLSRGANLQKFQFKRDKSRKAFGLIAPEVISDGERALLCSGFWGLSRHINYLGEILMAVGLTLALGRPLDPIPWLYPIYYLALLIPRQLDDDKRCAAKYGELWVEYCKRVRWRIVPCVY
jgi:delta14-sterol reductase